MKISSSLGYNFLFCNEDGDKDAVYIGELENVKNRLVQHINNNSSGKEKFYWNTAVIFTGRSLNKASIRYLETRLVKIATRVNRYKVLTKSTTNNPVLKESDKAAMEEFIDNIKVLLNTLGYKALEDLVKVDNKEDYYYLKTKDSEAKGLRTPEGFVVIKGARFSDKGPAKLLRKNQKIFRQKILDSDKVKDLIAQEYILFHSPSAAAVCLCGSPISGHANRKNKNGRSFKENETAK